MKFKNCYDYDYDDDDDVDVGDDNVSDDGGYNDDGQRNTSAMAHAIRCQETVGVSE